MLSGLYNKFRRITTNHLYFPEIDGIRFLAIVMVILFHVHGYFVARSAVAITDNPASYRYINALLTHGDRGVQLFFVLSGFILCLPFAHHYLNNGKKVSLKRYYLRRLTRLEPPYFIAMTGIFLIAVAMHIKPADVLLHSWLASLIYCHNIVFHHAPYITVVAWSLEIEIQFYLLAPLLFRVLAYPKAPRRTVLCAAIIAFVCAQQVYRPPFNCIYNYIQFFLAGILLADLYVTNEFANVFNKQITIFFSTVLLGAICYLPVQRELYAGLLFPFLILFFYYVILKNNAIKRVFSYKFVPVIGGMCYSIYLLHYTIISVIGRVSVNLKLTSYYLPNLLLQIVLLGIPILALSSIFYLYIERPFMAGKWLNMILKKDKHRQDNDTNPITN